MKVQKATRKLKYKYKKQNQTQRKTKCKIVTCCRHTRQNKQCIRKTDGKIFGLPRKWTRKQCLHRKLKGFTMRSSCAPYFQCK